MLSHIFLFMQTNLDFHEQSIQILAILHDSQLSLKQITVTHIFTIIFLKNS